ncbi:MAG: hypothetical protein COX80_01045 [Candidatus Magasanikbacteria bacterium CG_4_10_14_0_2_um_filter_33_14]|uniref:Uncharacterized protein n=1 Tax=Candidatus Magasanikbacteria bacterium CG_4_10_14_0_2_um_filter_33_14 TaxID=1974636 RepID=A0A2M7VBZ3_9BACT|nr:MAG: hypothetical protein COX80_01045 [Candidatus Magasanikbacteria bacterium CG_4_10_14_0_2_um_filter_33_14]
MTKFGVGLLRHEEDDLQGLEARLLSDLGDVVILHDDVGQLSLVGADLAVVDRLLEQDLGLLGVDSLTQEQPVDRLVDLPLGLELSGDVLTVLLEDTVGVVDVTLVVECNVPETVHVDLLDGLGGLHDVVVDVGDVREDAGTAHLSFHLLCRVGRELATLNGRPQTTSCLLDGHEGHRVTSVVGEIPHWDSHRFVEAVVPHLGGALVTHCFLIHLSWL